MLIVFLNAATAADAADLARALEDHFEVLDGQADDVLTVESDGTVVAGSPRGREYSDDCAYLTRCRDCGDVVMVASPRRAAGEAAREILEGRLIECVSDEYIRAGGYRFCRCRRRTQQLSLPLDESK